MQKHSASHSSSGSAIELSADETTIKEKVNRYLEGEEWHRRLYIYISTSF
jgi:tryptophanyl-tRNA synthetase